MMITIESLRKMVDDAALIAERARAVSGGAITEAVKIADELHAGLIDELRSRLRWHLRDGDGSDDPAAG